MVRWNTHANFGFAELVNPVHQYLHLQNKGVSYNQILHYY